MSAKFTPTPWPTLPIPSAEALKNMGSEKAIELLTKREELIRLEKTDPYRHGFEPLIWKIAREKMAILRKEFPEGVIEELDLGGNRASKTECAGKGIIKTLIEKPGARVWCTHSTQQASIQSQQPILWKYLPTEWKPVETGKMRKGVTTKIVYTQAGGFTEDTFVLPNGSQCWFKYYSQDISTLEGAELDEAWCDELVTPEWIKAIRYRLVTRSGKLRVTFTPVDGYTATVKEYLSGAITLEETVAELLAIKRADGTTDYERVPRIQKVTNGDAKGRALIFYFHTKDNPYGGYNSMKATLANSNRETILCRAYGVPTKAMTARLPKFNTAVHVVRANQVPKEGTRFHFVDPCSGRNWFMLWVIVSKSGDWFIYREWPCPGVYIPGVGDPGVWAEPDGHKKDGKRGPAQQPWGMGLKAYRDELARVEKVDGKPEVIFERYMDSRYGQAPTQTAEGSTTLLESCEGIGLYFTATSGKDIDEGIDLINDRLDYDNTKPVDPLNKPRLFVSEECQNTIYAMQEWTGADGRHGACKDPIDLVRYMALAEIDYFGEDKMKMRGGGCY